MGGFSKSRLERMRGVLQGYVENGAVPGFVALVDRGGETEVEALGALAYGAAAPMQRDTIFRIASITKPITAIAAMGLVEECRLRLDDPVDSLLPELADRKVLRDPRGPLENTVPANRPISLRDLLTLRMGLGYLMEPGEFPIMKAAGERGLLLGPPHPDQLPGPDEWIRRVGELPLMFQPGEKWQYDLSMDVLGVLIGRAAGQPFENFLRERIFEPLGMRDTGFYVPAEKIERLATSYSGGKVYDPAEGGEWSRPPKMALGSGGLVSTADNLLAFGRMMLEGGGEILSRASVALMTTDQVTAEQRKGNEVFFEANRSWGFGMAVFTRRDDVWRRRGGSDGTADSELRSIWTRPTIWSASFSPSRRGTRPKGPISGTIFGPWPTRPSKTDYGRQLCSRTIRRPTGDEAGGPSERLHLRQHGGDPQPLARVRAEDRRGSERGR